MSTTTKWIIGIIIGGLLLVIGCSAVVCGVFVATVADDLSEIEDLSSADIGQSITELSNQLANDEGREYMLAQPCEDVMAEYRALASIGHDSAVMHVSGVYNIKTGSQPYIAISDASARVEECSQ